MHSWWEKWSNQLTRQFFTCGTQFGKIGSKTLWECFEVSNDVFWGGKIFPLSRRIFTCYSTHRDLSNGGRSESIRVCMQKLCHLEVDLPVFTPIIQEDVASAPIIHGKGDSHMIVM